MGKGVVLSIFRAEISDKGPTKPLSCVYFLHATSLPLEQVRNLGGVLQKLKLRDLQRGLRRHHQVFLGTEAVQVLIESSVAKDETDALAIGNAFLREHGLTLLLLLLLTLLTRWKLSFFVHFMTFDGSVSVCDLLPVGY